MTRGYFVGLFLQRVAPADQCNRSRDDGGSLAVGRPLGNGHRKASGWSHRFAGAMVVWGAEVCGFLGWVGERKLGKISQFCRM